MKIVDHKLVAENATEKINHTRKASIIREYGTPDNMPKDLIIHYTAGNLVDSLNVLSGTKASVHLVIDRDGTIYQMIPFNKAGAHAGYSCWNEITSSFNTRSIGIEIINMGHDVKNVKASNIITIKHKHKFVTQTKWEKYPKAQMDAVIAVSKLLVNHYQLNRVLGHDDISAGRKQDPGPAFDWDLFKTEVFGVTDNIGKIYKVNTKDTNFRKSDNSNSDSNIIKPSLQIGYEVGLIETWGNWCKVYKCNSSDEVAYKEKNSKGILVVKNKKTQGWIYRTLLTIK
ncbi:MAG: N-acetylmuramoyl-L-alanine amidase [Sphingobacteriales bacterium]|jgi:N-acetylmuramoyl-L-alanine amidase|nr:MAG: N-acetylmuramoyl-L-alanine amidase [Sphingobacteriales bacterium]